MSCKRNISVKLSVTAALLMFLCPRIIAQCPPNIDFEFGTLENWLFYDGETYSFNGQNVVVLNQTFEQPDKFFIRSTNPGDGFINPGNIPRNCPNGSGHSAEFICGGRVAAAMAYIFTVPSDNFKLVYYYAVVVDDPLHDPEQQPRIQLSALDMNVGNNIACSEYAYTSGDYPTQGFVAAGSKKYKPWTAAALDFTGLAGHKIKLTFALAGCTKFHNPPGFAIPTAHGIRFLLDVSTSCDDSFETPPYCTGDTAITLTAPPGYSTYTWFDGAQSAVLGNNQTLTISPPPPPGTTYYVQMDAQPPITFGCSVRLRTTVHAIPAVTAIAGPRDTIQCSSKKIRIGGPPIPGLNYSWSPSAGLSDPLIANPLANVNATTDYVLTVTSTGGGCMDTDTITVQRVYISNSFTVTGGTSDCSHPLPTVIRLDHPEDSVQWYNESGPLPGQTFDTLTVLQSGFYYAQNFNSGGCSEYTSIISVTAYPIAEAKFTVNKTLECFPDNEFILKDTSHFAGPGLHYRWDFGDGKYATTQDAIHHYAAPGTYTISFKVWTDNGCSDEHFVTVTVKPGAKADFTVDSTCVNLILKLKNTTLAPGTASVNYFWDFGNGQTSVLKDPVYSYPVAGIYTIKLFTNTAECPDGSWKIKQVVIEDPRPGLHYPDQAAMINYPQKLEARSFGKTYLWSPQVYLDNPQLQKPVFRSFGPQQYNIRITTGSGCVTTDTLLVKTIKQITVNVAGAFTPNGDGINDRLHPLLFGFRKVNYFKVYNRLGQLLYESESDTPGWDGYYKGLKLDMQTVVWILEAVDVDGQVHHAQGISILMR